MSYKLKPSSLEAEIVNENEILTYFEFLYQSNKITSMIAFSSLLKSREKRKVIYRFQMEIISKLYIERNNFILK